MPAKKQNNSPVSRFFKRRIVHQSSKNNSHGDNPRKNFFISIIVIAITLGALESTPRLVNLLTGNAIPMHKRIPVNLTPFDVAFGFIFIISNFLLALLIAYFIQQPYKKERFRYNGFALSFFASFISVFIVCLIGIAINNNILAGHPGFIVIRCLIICFLASGYVYGERQNYIKQVVERENETLKRENLRSQYEVLKNELSPHFLFNSLNALQVLIRENPDVANQYVSHLSNVLRYSLQSSENQYIPLHEELELVDSYLFLLKMRYGDNLNIFIDLPPEIRYSKILPLTLQTLIENAVKHNEISKRNVLTISIVYHSENIVVTNNIQAKIGSEPSLGIGLSNLSQRYRIMSGHEIQVTNDQKEFKVYIPLLKKE